MTFLSLALVLSLSNVTYTTTTGSTAGYSVGWFSLALINAGLAQGKNRGGMNWFLLSLLLGPVATFLLVAFYPRVPEE
jgi:biotin transporter BioY